MSMEWIGKKRAEWLLLCKLWPEKSWSWRLKNIENFVDDPIDDIKHTLHGFEFLGYTLYLPSWMMQGSGKEGK